MSETVNFQEALYHIKRGKVASLIIGGVDRRYYLNQFGDIMCTPNGKEHLTYKVNTFHIDAVMSNDWKLMK